MGMYGIKQFEAVINPPQGMIMAIGAGEKRPYVINDALQIATVMSATGSFDHRAIDGADGARLMQAFKRLVENPLGMLAYMKWMTALLLGAILAFALPLALGGQDGVWMKLGRQMGNRPADRGVARVPVLDPAVPRLRGRLSAVLQLAQPLSARNWLTASLSSESPRCRPTPTPMAGCSAAG